jgi:hypothetical protein
VDRVHQLRVLISAFFGTTFETGRSPISATSGRWLDAIGVGVIVVNLFRPQSTGGHPGGQAPGRALVQTRPRHRRLTTARRPAYIAQRYGDPRQWRSQSNDGVRVEGAPAARAGGELGNWRRATRGGLAGLIAGVVVGGIGGAVMRSRRSSCGSDGRFTENGNRISDHADNSSPCLFGGLFADWLPASFGDGVAVDPGTGRRAVPICRSPSRYRALPDPGSQHRFLCAPRRARRHVAHRRSRSSAWPCPLGDALRTPSAVAAGRPGVTFDTQS